MLGLLKFIVYTLIIIALAGKFVTGSFMWDYEEYLPRLRQFLPVSNDLSDIRRVDADANDSCAVRSEIIFRGRPGAV